MATQVVVAGNREVNIDVTAPANYTTTDAYAVVTGSSVDARGWKSLSYVLKVATNAVKWYIYGANLADFSDEVTVNTEQTTAASANGSYSEAQSLYQYYRAKAKASVGGAQGVITLTAVQKG